MCICIDCWPWSTKGHTHTQMVSNSTSDHVSWLVFLFSCPQNPSINHLNFYCIKQIDYIFPCVYCNRSQKTSQRVKNNSHATRLRLVPYFFVLYTLWRHLWSITAHTRKNVIYLLTTRYVINQNSNFAFCLSSFFPQPPSIQEVSSFFELLFETWHFTQQFKSFF